MKSTLSWSIFKHFSRANTFCFAFEEVVKEFPGNHPDYLSRILSEMVRIGMLYKITRDRYHVIPLNADPKKYTPDGIQLAKHMVHGNDYYFGYASAMRILGLTQNQQTRIYVVTRKKYWPSIRRWSDTVIQFVQHDAARFFGFIHIWINPFEMGMVSDLERTIVDINSNPQHCGGIIEVGNALWKGKDRIVPEKLFQYFEKNRMNSAKKRFLYLTSLLDLKWTADHEKMMGEIGSGISMLDLSAPDQGTVSKKFGLKINVDPDFIKHKSRE